MSHLMLELLEKRVLFSTVSDLCEVPFFNAEESDPSGILNRFGGPEIPGIHATVAWTSAVVHSGNRSLVCSTNQPIAPGGFDFYGFGLTGFGSVRGSAAYIDTRDISHYGSFQFWLRNATGASFTLNFEIKDYRGDDGEKGVYSTIVSADDVWSKVTVPLDGLTLIGQPDLSRAKVMAFVFLASEGSPVNGNIYFDDMCFQEPGPAIDAATAPLETIAADLARRQFLALYGARDRTNGLLPNISAHADILALNVTAGVVAATPTAIDRGWITAAEANDWVAQLTGSLNAILDHATYLPPRYYDRVTLAPALVHEESPEDAAFMFLALYRYAGLSSTSASLTAAIESVLARFNFEAFSTAQGWKLAYEIDTQQFTAGTYDGYSGEIPVLSLAADLSTTYHVDMGTNYNSGVSRVQTSLPGETAQFLVHSSADLRAPFMQWLPDLFFKTADRDLDTYPDPALRANPHDNAVTYQAQVDAALAEAGRAGMLQPDAGDDGSGESYHEFSIWSDFGQPALYMPWSATLALLGDPLAADQSIRQSIEHGLTGPFGLTDSAIWLTGQSDPATFTARNDLWNTTLSTLSLVQWLYSNDSALAAMPAVQGALNQVFQPNDRPSVSIGDSYIYESAPGKIFAAVPIVLSAPAAQNVVVQYTTVADTAQSNVDYTSLLSSLTILAGQTQGTILVPISSSPDSESKQFFVRLITADNTRLGKDIATVKINVTMAAPQVTGVSVDSTAWSSSFPYQAAGYAIPAGSAQLTDLPWINLNQINIVFSQNVNVAESSLQLLGVNTPSYSFSGFSYNATTDTATWTLTQPIGADKLLIDLSDSVTNTSGVALDGEWSDGVSTYPSGNGTPGGAFLFSLNVLPGDENQSGGVNILDTVSVAHLQGSTTLTPATYSIFADVNGSGGINVLDTLATNSRQGSVLPSGSPAAAVLSVAVTDWSLTPTATVSPGDIAGGQWLATMVLHEKQRHLVRTLKIL